MEAMFGLWTRKSIINQLHVSETVRIVQFIGDNKAVVLLKDRFMEVPLQELKWKRG
jgi:hypothetical protein